MADAPAHLLLPVAQSGTPEVMTPTWASSSRVELERTFLENFTDFEPSAPPWQHHYGHDGPQTIEGRTLISNAERQIYVDPDFKGMANRVLGLDPFEVSEGVLRITGDKAPSDVLPFLGGYDLVSGLLSTQGHFEQQYGYFEARMRVPIGQGLWPAFWMKSSAKRADTNLPDWPPEIDVMEFIGGQPDRYYVTVHWDFVPNEKKSSVSYPVNGIGTTFRNFGVLWTRERTAFYLDRVPHHVIETKPNHHVPMFMLINLALGGEWPGPVDHRALPASLEVDWIAAWQLED